MTPTTPPTAANESTNPLRDLLSRAREDARARHRTMPGREAARLYSHALEQVLVRHIEDLAVRTGKEHLRASMSLLAVGGFGRQEMCFLSDVDFCFISEHEPSDEHREFIKAALYPLWDLKLELGYAVHSVRECLDLLGKDLSRTTSLLETRHLWGDGALSEELTDRLHSRLRRHHLLWFMASLREEIESRHERQGGTVFLLEPDVKLSRGGLRDLHQILWLAFALFGSPSIDAVVANSLMTKTEAERLMLAWSFLIDVRNSVHLNSNRRADKLTLERQVVVARAMGFEANESALAEEQLMRRYYEHATIVERLSQRLLTESLTRTPGTKESMSELELPRQLDRDFWARGGTIWIEPRDLSEIGKDPFWTMRLYLSMARERLEPAEETLQSVEETIPLIDDKYRQSPVVRDLFLGILRGEGNCARALRWMNRSGLLSAYLPEFAAVRYLPRIDHYHQFTVDEHMIRAVGVCEKLLQGQVPKSMEHAAEIAAEILRPDLLCFALLLHDVGKGEGRAHVIRGMHIVQRLAEEIGLRPIEQTTLRLLVAHHQKMSHMALRRDIEDPSLATELAQTVGTPEMLKMLYVHTCCDVRAVSQESWNEWRGKLIQALYENTMDELRGIQRERAVKPPPSTLGEEIWKALETTNRMAEFSRADVDHFLTGMPERYLRSVNVEAAVEHFALSQKLSDKKRLMFRIDSYAESAYIEITFIARDAPGLFGNLCGALASKRFNILSAQIYTASSGEAVDIFQVEVPTLLRAEITPILERLCERVEKVMKTGDRYDWSKSGDRILLPPITPERLNARPPRVDINNESSSTHTVIEVRAPDRAGLLSSMTRVFDTFGINIDLAFIATESYQIVDVFYVTDLETNKILEPTRLQALQAERVDSVVLESDGQGVASRALVHGKIVGGQHAEEELLRVQADLARRQLQSAALQASDLCRERPDPVGVGRGVDVRAVGLSGNEMNVVDAAPLEKLERHVGEMLVHEQNEAVARHTWRGM